MTVERRAERHAALGDPLRLRIVDLLDRGDRSPGELQAELGISSSLLAHHLNLLEGVGIAVRSRSEGDGRRSYVRLVAGSLDHLAPRSAATASRVVFVCRANSARSQLAAALWGTVSGIPVASAGTQPAARIEPGAISAAERHGIPVPGGSPRALAEVWQPGDFVVAVCDIAHEALPRPPALHWSVPDPVPVGTIAAYDAAVVEITRRVEALASRLTAA